MPKYGNLSYIHTTYLGMNLPKLKPNFIIYYESEILQISVVWWL